MKPQKRDVIAFVCKVEKKARATVQSKYNDLINEAHNSTMIFAEPYSSILKSITVMVNQIRDKYVELDKLASTHVREGLLVSLTSQTNQLNNAANNSVYVDNPVNRFINSYSSAQVKNLKDEMNNELKKIEIAYNEITQKIKAMRNMDKAVAYLKELGFDTSSLEDAPVAFDKRVLFPCKFVEGEK